VDSVSLLYDAFDRRVELNNGSSHYQIIYSPINLVRLTAQGNSSPYETVPLLMGAARSVEQWSRTLLAQQLAWLHSRVFFDVEN
jgi:hypothetical protein